MLRANLSYHIYDPNIIRVGSGSGDLTISQASTGAVNGNIILVKAGTYGRITIQDFDLIGENRVYIKNEGMVNLTSGMDIDNVVGVTIAGDYVSGIAKGFQFKNLTGRAIRIDIKFQRAMLKSMYFQNVADYCIAAEPTIIGTTYDGTLATRADNIKFIDLEFDNCTGIHWNGTLDYTTLSDTGFVNDVEVANCYWHGHNGSITGTYIGFTNVNNYNFHHNRFENLNAVNNNHNGIAFVTGQGDFHHNYLKEYQGDAIRANHISRGDTPTVTRVYNNIASSTRKYSAFEFQAYAKLLYPGKTTYGRSECFHNTVHNMHYADNTGTPTGNYHGVILDIYDVNMGNTTYAWNNVGVHFLYPVQDPLNYLIDGPITNGYPNSNRYYAELALAGITDDVEFRVEAGSPLTSGDVRTNPYTIDDFYGNERVGVPTIGAVQYV